ncbi:MAG: hypothetical protein LBE09_00600, partial [Christensenellaceae bacterium]|nr:hypothetical protein [Christensenellaceae bacterium]
MKKTLSSQAIKNRLFRCIALLLTLVVGVCLYFNLIKSNVNIKNTIKADEEPRNTVTQAINDADPNISFDFINGECVNSENYKEYVYITTMDDKCPDYRFLDGYDNKFTILAPFSGYTPGITYIISLNMGVKFENESYTDDGYFYFMIKRPQIVDVELGENVKVIEGNVNLEFVNDDIAIVHGIDGEKYYVGDIILITNNNAGIGQISLIVDEIVSHGLDYLEFKYSYPTEDDVVVASNIYWNQKIEFTEADFDPDSLNSVEENVAQLSCVKEMDEAVNRVYNTEVLRASNINPLITPVSKLDIYPNIAVNIKSRSPFEIAFTIKWTSDLKTAGQATSINLEAKIQLTIRSETEVLASEYNGTKNTSTIEPKTVTLAVTIGAAFESKVMGEIAKKYNQNRYKAQQDIWDSNYELSQQEKQDLIPEMARMEKWNGTSKNTKTHNDKVDFINSKNEAIEAENARIDAAKQYVTINHNPAERLKKALFIIKTPQIPLGTPVITFSFELSIFIDFEFKLELGLEQTVRIISEDGSVVSDGVNKRRNYHNEKREYYGKVVAVGQCELKVGLRAEGYFTFWGVVDIGIIAEGGAYVEVAGSFSYNYGKDNENDDFGNPWMCSFDAGWHVTLTAYASIKMFPPIKFEFFSLPKELASFLKEDKTNDTVYNITTKDISFFEYVDTDTATNTIPELNINEDSYVVIPDIYKIAYDIKKNINIEFNDILTMGIGYSFSESNYVYFADGKAFLKDTSIIEFDEVVTAYLLVDGSIDENTYLNFIIKKLPIKVESVEIVIDTTGIEVASALALNTEIRPFDASYKEVEFFINHITLAGVKIAGDSIGDRAEIKDNVLKITNAFAVGDSIGVKARALVDDVYSSVFEIAVVKTRVHDVVLLANGNRADIQPGGTLSLYATVSPVNATNKKAIMSILEGSQYASISADGFTLLAKEAAPINAQIRLVAMADGVSSNVRTITVGAIPVEHVNILSTVDNQELPRNRATNIQIGSAIKLTAVASPLNATVNDPQFKITSGATNATISTTGELRIGSNALIGSNIKVIANISGINSDEYCFIVDKVPIEQIVVSTYQNESEVMQGDRLQLYASVLPTNATHLGIEYVIIEGYEHANITPLGVLDIFGSATIGANVKVVASCDGVISDEISITIIKRPVESVTINISGTTIINEGQSALISTHILPSSASNKSVEYNFIEGGDIAYINEDGGVQIRNGVGDPNRIVRVQAVIDGICSNILTFTVFVSVESVSVGLESGKSELQKGEYSNLITTINPTYATNSNVTYEIVSNPEYATLNAFGVLSIDYDAPIGEFVGIAAIVDGIRSEELFIEILKIPVDYVEINGSKAIDVGQGKTYQLTATSYPLHASYGDITFSTSSTDYCEIDSETNIISIHRDAPIGLAISVVAIADSVESEEIVITVVAVSVSHLVISTDQTTLLPGDQISFAHEINEDASNKVVTFRIISGIEYASITDDGVLTIYQSIPIGSAEVKVIANADGVDSNTITISIYVPITMVSLLSDKYEVVKGCSFTLFENVNSNATDKRVDINILEGGQYIQSVDKNTYTVIGDITIPDAKVVLNASAQGVVSQHVEIVIIVPVESVNIYVDNPKPRQGESVLVGATYAPSFATNDGIKYSLEEYIDGVSINSITGEISIAYSVAEYTTIKAIATCGGVSSYAEEIIVQRIPAESVSIISTIHELRQGESLQLCATVLPEHTTYVATVFEIIEGTTFATISHDGFLKINQNATVGSIISIAAIAVADNIVSEQYAILVLKVDVEYVYISANGTTTLRPSETLQLEHEVSKNATFSDVEYSVVDGGEYASITVDGLLSINEVVNARFATVKVVGIADGVVSNIYQISIYNPAQSIEIISNKTTVTRGETIELSTVVNEFATSRNSTYLIATGSQFVDDLGDGLYQINSDITIPNAQIIFIASIDEILSDPVSIFVYIEVDSVEIIECETVIQPDSVIWLTATITPQYATNPAVEYYLVEEQYGIILNAETGQITVAIDALHNTEIQVYATSSDESISRVKTITVRISDILISVTDTVVKENDHLRITESFEHISFETVNYIITAISHPNLNFAEINVVGESIPTVYIDIDEVVTVRNYTFSVQAFADDIESNIIYFTIYVPVKWAILFSDKYELVSTRESGSSVMLSVDTNETATNQVPKYQIIEGSEYVDTIENGLLKVKTGVDIPNAVVSILATIDGYVCEQITLNIKVPVSNVELTVADGGFESHAAQQGEWLNLSATPYPLYASDRVLTYNILVGNEHASVDQHGFVTIYQYAPVGTEIQVIATADGVSSPAYCITVLKVPVTSLLIFPSITTDIIPGDNVQFFGVVNNGMYATYDKIEYFVESDEYASISFDGVL